MYRYVGRPVNQIASCVYDLSPKVFQQSCNKQHTMSSLKECLVHPLFNSILLWSSYDGVLSNYGLILLEFSNSVDLDSLPLFIINHSTFLPICFSTIAFHHLNVPKVGSLLFVIQIYESQHISRSIFGRNFRRTPKI